MCTSRCGIGISIRLSLNASHNPRRTSPLMLVTPFAGSSIQKRTSIFTALSPNPVTWQTGAGEATTRFVRLATLMASSRTGDAKLHVKADQRAGVRPIDNLVRDQIFVGDQILFA